MKASFATRSAGFRYSLLITTFTVLSAVFQASAADLPPGVTIGTPLTLNAGGGGGFGGGGRGGRRGGQAVTNQPAAQPAEPNPMLPQPARGGGGGGGYTYYPVVAASNCVVLMHTSSDTIYVNGEPHTGDTRNFAGLIPVSLHAGTNDFLVPGGGGRGRLPYHTDEIEAALIAGKWQAPGEGVSVPLNATNAPWRLVPPPAPNTNNAAGGGRGGRGGRGGGRGGSPVELSAPPAPVSINLQDPTLPYLTLGKAVDSWGGIIVLNATADTQKGLVLRATIEGQRAVETPLPALVPFSTRKVAFRLGGKAPGGTNARVALQLAVRDAKGKTIHSVNTQLDIRRPDQTQKRTFISSIDGSVQYWSLQPQKPVHPGAQPPGALFLSVHGAGVETTNQANVYSGKTWGNIAAATNRRPYGFDWEEWGRMDAMEVLEQAKAELHPDPQHIYLTGHSMGGHGTWTLGVTFPDKFAAIGPSAGWISFFTYGGGIRLDNSDPISAIFSRASASSDTLLMKTNYLQEGVFIIHGLADGTVNVREATNMFAELSKFHHDLQIHLEPGADHWWDRSDEQGDDCVDYAPLFDFFARHEIPTDEQSRVVNFTTVNPGVSGTCHWLEISQQIHAQEQSAANIEWDPGVRRFAGTTENIARLALSLKHVQPVNTIWVAGGRTGGPNSPIVTGGRGSTNSRDRNSILVVLDGQTNQFDWPGNEARIWMEKTDGQWRPSAAPSVTMKNPLRAGPFKDAFRHHMIFVYGTKGTPEENAWALAKARYDAEIFWYTGNGSIDIVPDTDFNPKAEPDRAVVLYGNADSNGAWPALLGDSPVQVRHGEIKVGDRVTTGDNLACLFLRPRPGSKVACVAAISGSGLVGMKLTDRINQWAPAVGFPDCTIYGSEMLTEGARGVRAAGFFGNDWSVEKGEFAWRDK